MTDPQLEDDTAPEMTILIADDHWVVRETLKQVTRSLSERFKLEEASSFEEALEAIDRNPTIGLLLVDLIMPGFAEFEGLQLLRRRYPSIPVVVVSIHEDPAYVMEAIRHGVIGYIPKSANAEEIKRALARVVSGEVAFPRDIIARGMSEHPGLPLPARPADEESRLSLLTPREVEIMIRLGRGTPPSDIADELNISRQTVRVHLGNAMRKLDISTREGAVHFATEHAKRLKSIAQSIR